MQNKRENVRHRIGLQFAARFFLPGVIVVGLLMLAGMGTSVATEGRSGRTFLLLSIWTLPFVVLVVVGAYAAARRNPRLAHKDLAAFAETQQCIIGIYQKSLLHFEKAIASLEQKQFEEINNAWSEAINNLKQEFLIRLRLALSELEDRDARASPEVMVSNQDVFINMYRVMRESEEQIAELEAMQTPEMSKETFEAIKAVTLATYERSRTTLQQHVDWLQAEIRNAQLSLAEARELL